MNSLQDVLVVCFNQSSFYLIASINGNFIYPTTLGLTYIGAIHWWQVKLNLFFFSTTNNIDFEGSIFDHRVVTEQCPHFLCDLVLIPYLSPWAVHENQLPWFGQLGPLRHWTDDEDFTFWLIETLHLVHIPVPFELMTLAHSPREFPFPRGWDVEPLRKRRIRRALRLKRKAQYKRNQTSI